MLATGRGVVTPEAVLLEFDTAGVASRVMARIIDAAIASAGVSLVLSILAPLFLLGEDGAMAAIILAGALGLVAYPCVCETVWGRTPGKALFGLRVVTEEGGPVRFRQAIIRAALQFVDYGLIPVGVVAVLSTLAGRRDQRLGDRLAGTLVVRSASLTMQSRAVGFPPLPGYEGYVAGLDVGALGSERYEVLRSFLTRVDELTPESRQRLALRLSAATAAAVGTAPGPSMHPEVFLASVAAAYQQRHGGPATWMWGPWSAQRAPMPSPPPLVARG